MKIVFQGLAENFYVVLMRPIAQINRAPATYPVLYHNIRRILTRRFPFGIFYIVIGSKIIVLAVLHTHREPSLWQRRNNKHRLSST